MLEAETPAEFAPTAELEEAAPAPAEKPAPKKRATRPRAKKKTDD